MKESIRKIGTYATIISVFVILGKCFGFAREIVLSHYYGASVRADAYIMSGNIVNVFFGWISTIYLCYTPVYLQIRHDSGEKRSIHFTRNLITLFLAIAVICVIITYVWTGPIVKIVAPGFSGETLSLTKEYLRISILILLMFPFIYSLKGYLECNSYFAQSSLADLMVSLFQVIIICISGVYGPSWLPFAMFIPYVVQSLVLIIAAARKGMVYKPEIAITPEIKLMLTLLIPYFISSLLVEINTFVDRYFASQLASGSVATLNYASVLNSFVMNVFSVALMTIIYPKLSEAIANKDNDKYEKILDKGLHIILFLFIPLTIGLLLLAPELVSCVYGHGALSDAQLFNATRVLRMYGIALIAITIRELFLRALYSTKDMKTPLLVGVFSTSLNIILNMILVRLMGIYGLALSTSISTIISLPLIIMIYRKKHGNFTLSKIGSFLLRVAVSSIFMIVAILLLKRIPIITNSHYVSVWINFIIETCVGAGVYFLIYLFLNKGEQFTKKGSNI